MGSFPSDSQDSKTMSPANNTRKSEKLIQYAPIFGVVLVVSGLLLLLDQRIKTTWLSISIPVVISLILIGAGIYLKKLVWKVPGLIMLGLSTFLSIMLQKEFALDSNTRMAIGFTANALAWLSIFVSFLVMHKTKAWWSLFVTAVCSGLSVVFYTGQLELLNFVLFVSVPVGMIFLVWGLVKRKLGLIIPGLLIGTIATGVYMGWSNSQQSEGLKETGTMLVWFALGWLLITVFSRIIEKKFIWWPLIPGGILLMVGSGLYIGGNPGNALGFLGNTGSIGLIIFGVYLILLKFGMKNKD